MVLLETDTKRHAAPGHRHHSLLSVRPYCAEHRYDGAFNTVMQYDSEISPP